MIKKKQFNIAIVGLGTIGSYLYSYLKKNKKLISKKTNIKINQIYVSAKNKKKKRKIKIEKKFWLKNYLSAATDDKIDLVVELIGGSEGVAKKLVFESLKNKKHVVTANKALIARHGDSLAKIAEEKKVNLEYEASVCGGVPIVRSIKEGLLANKITKVYGILNGTSNFILSSMGKDDLSFKEALKMAQDLGYAESNPKSDLNGEDVSAKLKILSSLCFNSYINKFIHVEGVKDIDKTDIQNANKLGYRIKLLGYSELLKNKICQRVHPVLIKHKSYIAGINGVLNAVIVDGKPVGQSVIQGEGAGPEATTSALVSDISSILRGNIKFPFSIPCDDRKKIKNELISNKIFSAYVRIDVKDKYGVLSDITKIFASNKVSIKRVLQNPFKSKNYSSIVIITHKSKDLYINRTLKTLNKKKYLIKKSKLIRIDENY